MFCHSKTQSYCRATILFVETALVPLKGMDVSLLETVIVSTQLLRSVHPTCHHCNLSARDTTLFSKFLLPSFTHWQFAIPNNIHTCTRTRPGGGTAWIKCVSSTFVGRKVHPIGQTLPDYLWWWWTSPRRDVGCYLQDGVSAGRSLKNPSIYVTFEFGKT